MYGAAGLVAVHLVAYLHTWSAGVHESCTSVLRVISLHSFFTCSSIMLHLRITGQHNLITHGHSVRPLSLFVSAPFWRTRVFRRVAVTRMNLWRNEGTTLKPAGFLIVSRLLWNLLSGHCFDVTLLRQFEFTLMQYHARS